MFGYVQQYWADSEKVWFFLNQIFSAGEIPSFGTCFAEIKSFVV
jgi:hypothetical protein